MSPGWSGNEWGQILSEGCGYGSGYDRGYCEANGTSTNGDETDKKDCCIIVNLVIGTLDINNTAGTSTGSREYTVKGEITTVAKKYCLKADGSNSDSDLNIEGSTLKGVGGDLECIEEELACGTGTIPLKYSFECIPGAGPIPSVKKLHLFSAEWFPCSVPCEPEVTPGWVQLCDCNVVKRTPVDVTLKWNMFFSHLGGLVSLAGVFGGVPQGVGWLGGTISRGLNCLRRFFEKLEKKKIKIGPKIDCNCDPMIGDRTLPTPELLADDPILPEVPGVGTITSVGRILTGGSPPCPPPSHPCDC